MRLLYVSLKWIKLLTTALDLDCLATNLMPMDYLALVKLLLLTLACDCPSMMIQDCLWTMRCPSHCTVAMTSYTLCRCLLLTSDEMPQLLLCRHSIGP